MSDEYFCQLQSPLDPPGISGLFDDLISRSQLDIARRDKRLLALNTHGNSDPEWESITIRVNDLTVSIAFHNPNGDQVGHVIDIIESKLHTRGHPGKFDEE